MEFLRLNSFIGMREMASNMSMLAGAYRHDEMRGARLSDLFMQDWDDEGTQRCQGMILAIYQMKTSKDGKLHYGAAMRNKEWKLCSHASMSFWLFTRFNVEGEDLPDLSDHDWYKIALFRNQLDKNESAKYDASKDVLERILDAVGYTGTKKLHVWRGECAKEGIDLGAEIAALLMHGR
jgi:hypothetical protein